MSTAAAQTAPQRAHRWTGRTVKMLVAAIFTLLVAAGLAAPTMKASALGFDSCTFLAETTGNGAFLVPNPGITAAERIMPGEVAPPTTPMLPSHTPSWRAPVPFQNADGTIDPAESTVFEMLRGQGQTWTTYGRTADGKAGCNILDQTQTMLASVILDVNNTMSNTAILIYAVATDNQGMFNTLYDKATGPAATLQQKVFDPLWPIALTCLGIWIGVMAVVRMRNGGEQNREGLTAVMASLGLGILVAVLIPGGWYLRSVQGADVAAATITSEITSSMLSGATVETDPCYLSQGSPDQGRRKMACQMWYSMSFVPWATGQYGTLGAEPFPYGGEDYTEGKMPGDARFQQAWLQTYSINEDARVKVLIREEQNIDAIESFRQQKGENWVAFAERAQKSANGDDGTSAEQAAWAQAYNGWRGEGSGARFTTGLNAVGGSTISSLAVIGASVVTLVWQMVPVLLMIALPLIAIIAMWPKLRSLFTGWVNLLVKSYVLRFLAGIALAIVLMIFQLIIEMNMAPTLTGMFQLVVAIGILMLFRIMKNAAPSGGDLERETNKTTSQTQSTVRNGMSTATGGRSGGGRLLGAAAGAGAAIGGVAALSKRRKAAQEAETKQRADAAKNAATLGEAVPKTRKEQREQAVRASQAREQQRLQDRGLRNAHLQADGARNDALAHSQMRANEAAQRAAEATITTTEATKRATQQEAARKLRAGQKGENDRRPGQPVRVVVEQTVAPTVGRGSNGPTTPKGVPADRLDRGGKIPAPRPRPRPAPRRG